MKRKCIVCCKIYGESGDKQNGSISGGICDNCMLAVQEYRHYRRMYNTTGFETYKKLMSNSLQQLEGRCPDEKKKETAYPTP